MILITWAWSMEHRQRLLRASSGMPCLQLPQYVMQKHMRNANKYINNIEWNERNEEKKIEIRNGAILNITISSNECSAAFSVCFDTILHWVSFFLRTTQQNSLLLLLLLSFRFEMLFTVCTFHSYIYTMVVRSEYVCYILNSFYRLKTDCHSLFYCILFCIQTKRIEASSAIDTLWTNSPNINLNIKATFISNLRGSILIGMEDAKCQQILPQSDNMNWHASIFFRTSVGNSYLHWYRRDILQPNEYWIVWIIAVKSGGLASLFSVEL